MKYTLDICGDKTVEDPSEAAIRTALEGLNARKGNAFLILESSEGFMQTTGDPKVGFDLEYQDSVTGDQYRAMREFTAEEITTILVAYMNGGDQWKQTAHWERV